MNTKTRIESMFKLVGLIAIGLFCIQCLVSTPENTSEIWSLAIKSAGYTVPIAFVYEKWLWRFNPLAKTPKLKINYDGLLKYNYKGIYGEKNIAITIRQTYLTTKITIVTDEIESNTITSELLIENDKYVLYYTYITNPKSEYSDENPIQLGTCRIAINNVNKFSGKYWTNRKTIGDIDFKAKL